MWRPPHGRQGNDVTVVAFGAMVHEALAAAAASTRSVEVWNPFVLQPLDLRAISASVQKTGRLLVVQECGGLQGLGDAIISRIVQERLGDLVAPPRLIAAPDAPVPFAPELETSFRPAKARILAAIDEMLGGDGS
ncbi:MAG: hypothetical protein NUV77_21375 [Thermoguttaceae bacterium]|nr:hypothetical protein [Thermoguttaceae bacterium]